MKKIFNLENFILIGSVFLFVLGIVAIFNGIELIGFIGGVVATIAFATIMTWKHLAEQSTIIDLPPGRAGEANPSIISYRAPCYQVFNVHFNGQLIQ